MENLISIANQMDFGAVQYQFASVSKDWFEMYTMTFRMHCGNINLILIISYLLILFNWFKNNEFDYAHRTIPGI